MSTADTFDDSLEVVFAMVKPLGVAAAPEILRTMMTHGFTIVWSSWRHLTETDVLAIYPDLYDDIRAHHGSAVAAAAMQATADYLCSAPCLLVAAVHDEGHAHRRMLALRGESHITEFCSPGTIRRDFPGSGVRNSLHCSASPAESRSTLTTLGIALGPREQQL